MAVVVASESICPVRRVSPDVLFLVVSERLYIRPGIVCLLLIDHITRNEDLCFFQTEKKDSIVSVSTLDSCYAVTAVRVPAEKCIDGRIKAVPLTALGIESSPRFFAHCMAFLWV